METRSLGASGLSVTLVGLGCNNFGGRIDLEATRKVVDEALDLGINHFDTADIYGGAAVGGFHRPILGDAAEEHRARHQDSASRWTTRASSPAGRGAMSPPPTEASLKRLRTDWIDLLYMHEPDRERRSRRRFAPSTI